MCNICRSILTEESAKIFVIVCGLIINLIINLIAHRDILSTEGNKRNYFLIWILSGVFIILVSCLSRVAGELRLLFYAVIGLSVPQVGLYLMLINNLKERVKTSEDSLENYAKVLYLKDIRAFLADRKKGVPCIDIKTRALQQSENYKQLGIFDEKKANDYLTTIKMITNCYW